MVTTQAIVVSSVTTQTTVCDADNSTWQSTNAGAARATAEVATYRQLMAFSLWYQAIHGYVCVVVCVFGIAANVVNIVVLTRRNMVRQSGHIACTPCIDAPDCHQRLYVATDYQLVAIVSSTVAKKPAKQRQ